MSDSIAPLPRPHRNEGWVYFISDGEAIKIGWSPNPHTRKKALATGNPRPLKVLAQIPGSIRDEKLLHLLLAPYRIRTDGEWFRAEKPLWALVDWAKRYGHSLAADREEVRTVSAIEARVSEVSFRLYDDYRKVKEAVRGHLAEVERAIDATDDHEGLSDALRTAALELATVCHGPSQRHLDAIFDAIGDFWYLAGEVEVEEPDEAEDGDPR